jgi:aryl-alcohol dehydrogenase-like predicted oxidoreductase
MLCYGIDLDPHRFSPWTTDIEHNGVADACRELGVAIIAYSPLGRGVRYAAFPIRDAKLRS